MGLSTLISIKEPESCILELKLQEGTSWPGVDTLVKMN